MLGNDFALDDISFAPVFIKRDSVRITIDTPMISTTMDTALCRNTPLQITTVGANQYSWSPVSGLNAANIANPVATPLTTTQYIVSGTNANGCVAKDTLTLTVKPLPTISVSADDTICVSQSVTLQASGGVSYTWTPAATLSNPTISNPVASPTSNTVYTVLVTGSNNCSNKDSVKITQKPIPVFNVSADKSICVNGKAQLTASGGTSYLWSPALYLNSATISNP
ncbi:MAG: hypothetical protein EOO39_28145, partial [Cytophagaceae bacterium]